MPLKEKQKAPDFELNIYSYHRTHSKIPRAGI